MSYWFWNNVKACIRKIFLKVIPQRTRYLWIYSLGTVWPSDGLNWDFLKYVQWKEDFDEGKKSNKLMNTERCAKNTFNQESWSEDLNLHSVLNLSTWIVIHKFNYQDVTILISLPNLIREVKINPKWKLIFKIHKWHINEISNDIWI